MRKDELTFHTELCSPLLLTDEILRTDSRFRLLASLCKVLER